MEHAHARRPRGYQEARRDAPRALRAVPAPDTVEWPSARPDEARRTIEITGQSSAVRSHGRPRPSRQRSRPARSASSSPDRLALWAVVLCLFMALVAAATARGDEGPGGVERDPDPAAPAVESRR